MNLKYGLYKFPRGTFVAENIIPKLEIKFPKVNDDDRGILYESYRDDELLLSKSEFDSIKQIYIVQNHNESIRAFHRHTHLIDVFTLVRGYAKFIFLDISVEEPICQIINVSDKKPTTIVVPKNIFHGWKGSPDCILVSAANKMYMGEGKHEKVDEERIPWDMLGEEVWETKFK